MYGSYAKGHANPDSDIDRAVILPASEITDHREQSADLWGDIGKVSVLIEPVLMAKNFDKDIIVTGTYSNGIEELNNTEELNVPVYNVQGMKIDRSRAHGLVIVGGKKVVVK